MNLYIIWLFLEFNLLFLTFFLKPIGVGGMTSLIGGIGLLGYIVFRSQNRSLKNTLYETERKKDEWMEKILKLVMKYGGIFIIIVIVMNIIFPQDGVRTDIISSIAILGMWFVLNIAFILVEAYLYFPYLLYGYYKYKYPEEYRDWEAKTQIEWYGEKYFNKHIKGTEKEEKTND